MVQLSAISTPLVLESWARALASHPDQAFARYVCEGIQHGFRIGFQHGSPLKSTGANMDSARQHPHIITEYLQKELSLGRMLGPFKDTQSLPPLHINRFGVIPKGHNTGKWRLITDLSYPPGQSVNDSIDPDLCSMVYTTVDDAAAVVSRLGDGALMAKVDIESAYRLVPVHPDDRPLLAMLWEGHVYVDPMLPFGLRSAPKIFNALADALHWHLQQSGVGHIQHYLDDYIIIGPPHSPQCGVFLQILLRECSSLGVPIAEHKTCGPTTCLVFLGIEIDSVKGELRLPHDKRTRLQTLLQQWGDRKVCSRKELESLIGLLNHACKVVRSGRAFLRRMIDLLHHRPHESFHIRLNRSFRSDLAWWQTFLPQWNGISFLPPPSLLPSIVVTTDASGSWGAGAWHQSAWFQVCWDHRAHALSIVAKELIPIILACHTWGTAWNNQRVLCQCDNQVVVACLRSRTSRDAGLMHLIRCLVFVEALRNCFLYPQYISTKDNHLADDLSRNDVSSFLSKVPSANSLPSTWSQPLLDLLLDPLADWTSPAWRRLFSSTSNMV